MNYKLTDAEFWSVLRENGGLFARTARHIQSKYKISYSRQAVQQRATGTLEARAELDDIIEETIDIAEETIQTLVRTGPPNIRLEAAKTYLRIYGKDRGWGERPVEIAATASTEAAQEEQPPMGSGLKLTIRVMGAND